MSHEKPTLGEYRVEEEHDVAAFRQKLGAAQVTGNQLGPFLKMRPTAALVVKIDQRLVPVRDVYYDNEFGVHVIEIDLTVDTKPPTGGDPQ